MPMIMPVPAPQIIKGLNAPLQRILEEVDLAGIANVALRVRFPSLRSTPFTHELLRHQ
jgi:hypothetical protein